MKLRNLFLSVFAAASILVACNEDEPVAEPSIEVSVSELSLEKAASENSIAVKSNRSWIIDEASEWITVTPGRGGASDDNQVIVVSVPENTGYDREGSFRVNIGFTSKKVIVKQAGSGSYEDAVLYANNFDKEEATQTFGSGKSWPYLDQFDGWKNESGTGVSGISYDFKSISARTNSASNSKFADYAGSGSNNLLFGSDAFFAIKDIALGGAIDLNLSFGAERYLVIDNDKPDGNTFKPSEFHVYVSEDNEKWVEISYAFPNGFKDGRWDLASSVISVPSGTEKLSIWFASDIASGHRLDDVSLIVSTSAGTEIDFSKGTAIGEGGSITPDPPTPVTNAIFANDFDKVQATQTFGSGSSWPYLDQFDGWKNQGGTGVSGISYGYKSVSVRANSASDSKFSDYSGSGANNLLFGTDAAFIVRNIVLGGATKLSLSFGTERYINGETNTFKPSEFHVYISEDNENWVELAYEFPNGFKDGRWDLASTSFEVPASTEKLSIYFASDIRSGHRLDDIKLVKTENHGEYVNFAAGISLPAIDTDDPAGNGGGSGNNEESTAATAGWLELPETSSTDGLDFFTHDATLSGKKIRNWSFYWDYDNRVANWVAYPLYTAIYSGAKRSDDWGYDPLLPADKQQNVSGGYRDGNNGWYTRGHQLPSADRNGNLNNTTFYSTNMTPQNSDFNGGVWANLEAKVRSWAGQSDTCYVVTGCVTTGAKYYSVDRSGNHITVPTSYFKAVLRYSKSSTIGQDGFSAVGFWFDHEEYSKSGKSSLSISKSMGMSIEDLEKKLGYKLFVNLPAAIGEDKAAKVKKENPQNVNWWWK